MQVSKVPVKRRTIGLLLAVLGLAVLAFQAWQIVTVARSLQSRLSQAQALAQSAHRSLDMAQVEVLLMGARADTQSLKANAGPWLWLAPYLGWLPGIGGDVQAAPALLEMADGLTEAGVIVWNAMSPLVVALNAPEQDRAPDRAANALAQIAASRPQLEQARSALERAVAARARIRTERLSQKLAGPLGKLDSILPLARVGADLALTAPDALGMDGPRAYLILAQNEDEIRPTGGFISGAGRMAFDRGKLIEFSFMDANVVDDLTKPYPDWPEPLARYMGMGDMLELWLFRDSNWSPDFPTSAKQAADFYTYGQGVPVDGVIAIDQRVVQMLVGALGPVNVTLSNTQLTVTGSNIVSIMREAWNPPGGNVTTEWVMTRKGFMGQLATAVRARMESDPGSIPWAVVGRTVLQALDERHILIFMQQPDLAAILSQQGWDGALRPAMQDYLMVVDANVGYGKANAVVERQVNYAVTLAATGGGRAELSLDYRHAGTPGIPCQQEMPYGPQITYQSMVNRCFYNYARVLVPQGARLLGSTRQSLPASYFLSRRAVDSEAESVAPEAGKSVWAMLFVVETGTSWQARLIYELPASITQAASGEKRYSLWIQKQPGQGALPTVVTVNLPTGAQVNSTIPAGNIRGNQVGFSLNMTRDTFLEVRYRE